MPGRLPLSARPSLVLAPGEPSRFIHLLYAPTNFCNMGCAYCYLGRGTDVIAPRGSPLDTLASTVDELVAAGVVPFNVSFHGGEPTAIPAAHLEELLAYAQGHYARFGDRIKAAGLPLNPVHVKTNLYNFDQLEELFARYQVSVSASVDLPLSLHGRYRTDKRGRSTRDSIEANLRLLARYPYHKKISCVVSRAHLREVDNFVRDLRRLHEEIGLDMTTFNVMFAFDSAMSADRIRQRPGELADELAMLSPDEQVAFYRHLRDAFTGTDFEEGLRTHWFKEFTPAFCCSALNCGEKFFLLQRNGDVYSCPRGQSAPRFCYGNVFEHPIREILDRGRKTIEAIENTLPLEDDCTRCTHLTYCYVGCTFVRAESRLSKSYTCKLQKELYAADPDRYPPLPPAVIAAHARGLKFRNNLKSFTPSEVQVSRSRYITDELHDDANALSTLIADDSTLQHVYSDTLFCVEIDGVDHPLRSPVLNNESTIALIRSDSRVWLHVRQDLFELHCRYPVNNHLHLMLLRNTMVTYGDEQRRKQEHLADYSIYQGSLIHLSDAAGAYRRFDLMPLLALHRHLFLDGVRLNLLATSKTLREYHYKKQQENAFYHIQAINLPFPQLEFHWRDHVREGAMDRS